MSKDATKLWLLTNNTVRGYDTYDSMVVAADTEEDARNIHPNANNSGLTGIRLWHADYAVWCKSPDDVVVEYLGVTHGHRRGKVIISSFNAG